MEGGVQGGIRNVSERRGRNCRRKWNRAEANQIILKGYGGNRHAIKAGKEMGEAEDGGGGCIESIWPIGNKGPYIKSRRTAFKKMQHSVRSGTGLRVGLRERIGGVLGISPDKEKRLVKKRGGGRVICYAVPHYTGLQKVDARNSKEKKGVVPHSDNERWDGPGEGGKNCVWRKRGQSHDWGS